MSERFPAEWLLLREPVDHRSRAPELVQALIDGWGDRPEPVRIVDLATGAGSNLRYLAGRLPWSQAWTLVDHDEALLERASAQPVDGTSVSCALRSLAVEGVAELERAVAPVPSGTPDLVTASALFDLVSEPWLRQLARVVTARGAAALFALSYDGRIEWGAPDPHDALVLRAVNMHQRGDKGFGPALGPSAGEAIGAAFASEGYRVRSAASPWRLGPADRALVLELLQGWAGAAAEQEPDAAGAIAAWHERRAEQVTANDFALTVGHVDVLALPG